MFLVIVVEDIEEYTVALLYTVFHFIFLFFIFVILYDSSPLGQREEKRKMVLE